MSASSAWGTKATDNHPETGRNIMKTSLQTNHRTLVEELRRRVLEGPGEAPSAARQEAAKTAAGVSTGQDRYSELTRQIGDAAYLVTDAQVASVLSIAGSEKAAFEIIAAAALGAGLLRWQQAIKTMEEASDATK
jgi:hypothetical protein